MQEGGGRREEGGWGGNHTLSSEDLHKLEARYTLQLATVHHNLRPAPGTGGGVVQTWSQPSSTSFVILQPRGQ